MKNLTTQAVIETVGKLIGETSGQLRKQLQDEVAALVKRIDDISLQPGPQGEPGVAGKDAEPVDVDVLAACIVKEHGSTLKGEKGDPAEPVDPIIIADKIFERYADKLKGERGADAPVIYIEDVTKDLVENYKDDLKGTGRAR